MNFIYSKIHEFIEDKLISISNLQNDKKKFMENKLIKMIKELGPRFKQYTEVNKNMEKMHILEILNPVIY